MDKRWQNIQAIRVSHGAVLAIVLALAILLVPVASILLSGNATSGVSGACSFGFACNALLALVALVHELLRRPFSMEQIHWLFYLTFFVIAPFSQLYFGFYPWDYYLSEETVITANFFLFIWGMLVLLVTVFRRQSNKQARQSYEDFFAGMPTVSAGVLIVFLALSLLCVAYLIQSVGLWGLLARGTRVLSLDQTSSLLFGTLSSAIPLFTFVFAFVRYKQQKGGLWWVLCALALLLIADFPLGIARYNAAAIYGGIVLLCCKPIFEQKGLFCGVFLLVFLFMFPAMAVFRHDSFEVWVLVRAIIDAIVLLPEGFCTGDYDAYSMLCRSIDYVSGFGPTNGQQLLTALLFFVPRSLWTSKGVGSGSMIATAQGQQFTNVSCPLPAEGYVNFGLVGLLVFAIFIAGAMRYADVRFEQSSSGVRLLYPFLCLLLFFVLRGDLLSSYGYVVGYTVVFFVMYQCVKHSGGKTKT